MDPNRQQITYPFVWMNHIALILVMMYRRFFFVKQAEHMLGMPIRILPFTGVNQPMAVVSYDKGDVRPLDLNTLTGVPLPC